MASSSVHGSPPPGRLCRLLRAVLLLGALVPAAVTATQVLGSLPNVPFWDQWQFTETLALAREGRLSLADLWAPHNEHRIPLARILLLDLARVSDWDVRWELGLNLLLAAGTLGLLIHVLRRTVGTVAPGAVPWIVLCAAVLLFSPAQWEGFVWGWTAQIFLVQLAAALLAASVLHARGRWGDLALQLVATAAGALSYGAGLALLAIAPLAALFGPGPGTRRRRLAQAGIASAFGLLLALAYAHGNPGPAEDGVELTGSTTWRGFAGFVLGWIGAGTGTHLPAVALGLGIAGVASFAACAAWIACRAPELRRALAPWLALGIFALGAAVLTAGGRLGYGYEQALIPRYVTLSLLFWIAWLAVAALALARWLASASFPRAGLAAAAAAAGGILTLAACEQAGAWTLGRAQVRQRALLLEHGAALLACRERAPEGSFSLLFHDPEAVSAWAGELERLGLGPFARAPGPAEDLGRFTLVRAPSSAGFLDSSAPDPRARGCRILRGWAVDPFEHGAVESVLVADGRRVIACAPTTLDRPDVARALDLEDLPCAGFEVHVPEFALEDGGAGLRVYARLCGDRIVPLAGQAALAAWKGAPAER